MSYEDATASGSPLRRLMAHALNAVAAVVPASSAAFVRVSRRMTAEEAVVMRLGGSDAPRLPSLREIAARDVGAGVVGRDREMTMCLRDAGHVVGAVALWRSGDLPPFARSEWVRLHRLQPLIEQAYVHAIRPRGDASEDALENIGLTPRERDIAQLVGQGATNAEIATTLQLSETTVKTHLAAVYAKAGVRSRTQLALLLGEQARVPR